MADVWRQKLGTGERWTEEDGRAALAVSDAPKNARVGHRGAP